MKWNFRGLLILVLLLTTCTASFAKKTHVISGLERAKNYHGKPNGKIYIQAGSFSRHSNAVHYQSLIHTKTTHPVKMAHKQGYYTVTIGPLRTALEARQTATKVLPASKRALSITETTVHFVPDKAGAKKTSPATDAKQKLRAARIAKEAKAAKAKAVKAEKAKRAAEAKVIKARKDAEAARAAKAKKAAELARAVKMKKAAEAARVAKEVKAEKAAKAAKAKKAAKAAAAKAARIAKEAKAKKAAKAAEAARIAKEAKAEKTAEAARAAEAKKVVEAEKAAKAAEAARIAKEAKAEKAAKAARAAKAKKAAKAAAAVEAARIAKEAKAEKAAEAARAAEAKKVVEAEKAAEAARIAKEAKAEKAAEAARAAKAKKAAKAAAAAEAARIAKEAKAEKAAEAARAAKAKKAAKAAAAAEAARIAKEAKAEKAAEAARAAEAKKVVEAEKAAKAAKAAEAARIAKEAKAEKVAEAEKGAKVSAPPTKAKTAKKVVKASPAPMMRELRIADLIEPTLIRSDEQQKNGWLATLGLGMHYPYHQASMTVNNGSGASAPFDQDIYTTTRNHNPNVQVAAGYRWVRDAQWFPAYSISLSYQHLFATNAGGDIMLYSDPNFINYRYDLDVTSEVLLVSSKFNIFQYEKISPYVLAGIGGVYHQTNYKETALSGVTPRTTPVFASNPTAQFAYSVGAGLDYQVSKKVVMSLEYQYQSLGSVSTWHGAGDWSGESLNLGPYRSNTVLLNVTYLFGQ